MGKKIRFYCENPDSLDQDSLLAYKEALTRYPYCQYAHLMFLLNLKKTGDEGTFKAALPHVAITVPDRSRLKEQVSALEKSNGPEEPENRSRFSPFQDSLPKRQNEGFSPWSQALPISSRSEEEKRQEDGRIATEENEPGFRPVVENGLPEKEPSVPVSKVRSLLDSGKESKPDTKKADTEKPLQARTAARRKTASSDPEKTLQQPASPRLSTFGPDSGNRTRTNAIIDRFLKGGEEHLISLDENFDYNSFDPDTGHSTREDFSFGSETLAEMYLKNGSPEKAIAVYEHLGLNFPEKSSYFANLIRKVKKEYSIK